MAPEKRLIRIWPELVTASLVVGAVLAVFLPLWALPILILGAIAVPSAAVWLVGQYRQRQNKRL
jgi:Flp pilus assembly protein TadB